MNHSLLYGTADIETLGHHCDAVVLSAAFVIDRLDQRRTLNELKENAFSAKLDVKAQFGLGRHRTTATMEWWKNQSAAAQQILIPKEDDLSPEEFTVRLLIWAQRRNIDLASVPMGARGYLDFSVLSHMWDITCHRDVRKIVPHWNVEEIRTALKYLGQEMYAGLNPDEVEGFIHHSAVDDAALDWLRMQKALLEAGAFELTEEQ